VENEHATVTNGNAFHPTRLQGVGFRVQRSGLRVEILGFRVSGLGVWIHVLVAGAEAPLVLVEFRVWSFSFGVSGLGFQGSGFDFLVPDFGFR